MKKGLYLALILILVAAFVGSALYLGNYFVQGKKEAELNKSLSDTVETARQEAMQQTAPPQPTFPEGQAPLEALQGENVQPTREEIINGSDFLPWYEELRKRNSDMIGWLKIENSKIDYPVMQTTVDNPNFYLYRNFDKEDSIWGSLYVREECDVFAPSDNVTIYGHNMRDGSMFAYLGEYYDKSVWEENPLIFFDTLTESHVYKIFSVFKTSANVGEGFEYHEVEDAANEAEFNQFIATCKQLAFYDTGITPVYGDKIICLSTCEYTLDNGRFVVAAVRIT